MNVVYRLKTSVAIEPSRSSGKVVFLALLACLKVEAKLG